MSKRTDRKIALIGGGGVRSPLVVFGVNEAAEALGASEMVLYDPDPARLRIMVDLGKAVIRRFGGDLRLRGATSLEDTIEGADFVLNSIRIGGIAGRAADERTAIDHGYPGQETTGPAGVAMALRTIPIAIEQARLVERLSPEAWLVNFTNPAGLITQAVSDHSKARIVGICDTPTELFHNIAHALGEPAADVECDYVGLNHLGWVRVGRHRSGRHEAGRPGCVDRRCARPAPRTGAAHRGGRFHRRGRRLRCRRHRRPARQRTHRRLRRAWLPVRRPLHDRARRPCIASPSHALEDPP